MANLGEVIYQFKRNKSKAFAVFEVKLREKYDKPGMIFSISDSMDPSYLTFIYAKKWNYAAEWDSPAFPKKQAFGVYDAISGELLTEGCLHRQDMEAFCFGLDEIISGSPLSNSLFLAVGAEEVGLKVKGHDPDVSRFFKSQYGVTLPSGIDYTVYTDSSEIRAMGDDWDLKEIPGNVKKIPLAIINDDSYRDDDKDPLDERFISAAAAAVLLPDLKTYLKPQDYKSICAGLMAAGLSENFKERDSFSIENRKAIKAAYYKLCCGQPYKNIRQEICDLQKEILENAAGKQVNSAPQI